MPKKKKLTSLAALQELAQSPPPQEPPVDEQSPQSEQKPKFEKPKILASLPPQPCQPIRILNCDQPISRVFCECWHCKQGLLVECDRSSQPQDIDAKCPNCGKTAIKLMTRTGQRCIERSGSSQHGWMGDKCGF